MTEQRQRYGAVPASRNVGVILAGGSGNRLGLDYPKQFAKVAGKQLIEHTIEIFQTHHAIDEIVIVSKAEYAHDVLELVNRDHYSKVTRVVNGGSARTDSTLAAIEALQDHPPDTNVLFHDAVRPFLSHSVIDRCIEALETAPAVDVVIPSADTLVAVDEAGFIKAIPDRSSLRRGQTPQAFKLSVIREAYEIFVARGDLPATCDCGVLLRAKPDIRIATVEGDAANIKVTEPIDMFLADKLFQSRGDVAIVETSLPHVREQLEGKVLVVFGGTSGIGASIAELATSNGATVHCYSRRSTGTDVASATCVSAALNETAAVEGRIDFVVNTAGTLFRRPLIHMEQSEIEVSIDTNLRGAFNVARLSFPYLRSTRGALLMFTSSSYTRGRAFLSVYSATKAAVVNLTQALAEEWEPEHVKVNCMNPERAATAMRRQNFGFEPPETLLTPDQVAEASLAVLASGRSGHIVDVRIRGSRSASVDTAGTPA